MLKAASPFELNRQLSIFNGREALALLVLGIMEHYVYSLYHEAYII